MYVVTSMPLVNRTRATLRSAELGFFGVCVNTRTQTPRFCGLSWSAGLFVLVRTFSRSFRTSWLIVGIVGSVDLSAVFFYFSLAGAPPPLARPAALVLRLCSGRP